MLAGPRDVKHAVAIDIGQSGDDLLRFQIGVVRDAVEQRPGFRIDRRAAVLYRDQERVVIIPRAVAVSATRRATPRRAAATRAGR